MTAEGRNIFDLVGNPQAIEDQDYEFYCPINLDDEGKINKNSPDYFMSMKKCQLDSDSSDFTNCRTVQTLEQQFSGSVPGCLTESGVDCVNDVWRDVLGRWYR